MKAGRLTYQDTFFCPKCVWIRESPLYISHPRLALYVRGQLLHTVALMVKRATLDSDRRKLFDSVFTTVSQLLMMDAKMVSVEFITVAGFGLAPPKPVYTTRTPL